jgi:large subunit ribosomal protein L25
MADARYHRRPMPQSQTTILSATSRVPAGSRTARRLRRTGQVPGVVYGGGAEPLAFEVGGRELRLALAQGGAVLDLQLDDTEGTPVVLKELVRHPVSGDTLHVDLLRVRLDVAIQAQVTIELTGVDDAPGVRTGGVLEHTLREVTVEALPTDIPDVIRHEVSSMEIGDTLTLSALAAPEGVKILGEPDTLIAAVSAPRLQLADEETEIETETEVVGEGEGGAEPEAEAATAADGESGGD